MAKCENCNERFDRDEAASYFEMETGLSYDNLRKTLCGECAVQAIEDLEDGVYSETCEECGRTFDLIEDQADFDSHFDLSNGTSLRDYWDSKILCCECAIEKAEEDMESDDDDDDDDGMSPACSACGNPAYPECMDDCPLFDD